MKSLATTSAAGSGSSATVRVACAVVMALWLATQSGCRESTATTSDAPPTVKITQPQMQKVTNYVYYTGRTEAVKSVEIRARVTGYQISFDFVPGGWVKTGQRLIKVDPRPYQATLDEANGQIKLNQAQLKLAQADYARALEVAKTPGAISQQDLDTYLAKQDEAAAALEAAQANAESAKLNLQFTDVTSPIDGIVGRNLLANGNLISQDATLLTTVVSQDPIYVYFDVDENTVLRVQDMIKAGKFKTVADGAMYPVDMALADEGDTYPHHGTVDFVNNQLDPGTSTLELRGVFDNPPVHPGGPSLLQPGLFVRVRLPIGEPYEAMVVPQKAVNSMQGDPYLLVVNKENVVEYRPVTLGPEVAKEMQVVVPVKIVRDEDGMRLAAPGEPGEESLVITDRVIVSGMQRARPRLTVDPQSYNPADADQLP